MRSTPTRPITVFRMFVAACGAAVLVALAGCGGDDQTSVESDEEPTAASSTTTTAADDSRQEPDDEGAQDSAGGLSEPRVRVPDGPAPERLRVKDLTEGQGVEVAAGDRVLVHYVGVAYSDGKKFDASWDREEPFTFQLGAGMVIPGWDRGIEGMRVGGRRQLTIPPRLAYGSQGAPPVIGPGETLVFVIDLLEIQ